MFKIKWLLERWLEEWLYHTAHRLIELSFRLSQKPPDKEVEEMKEDGLLYVASPIHELKQNWRGVIASAPVEIRKTNAIAILLSAGIEPVSVEGDTVVLTTRYPIHKTIMEMPENQDIADQIMSNFFGRPMHVSFN